MEDGVSGSNKDGVIVYPEGHRYTGKGTLPLKTGVLEVAFNLKVPCQCVLSMNKESILNEKELSFNYDVPIYTSVSEVFDPSECETKEEWFAIVREKWSETVKDLEECKEFKECSMPLPGMTPEMTHSYTPNNKKVAIFLSVVFVLFSILLAVRHF